MERTNGRIEIDTTELNEAVRLAETADSIGGEVRRQIERKAALAFWKSVGMSVERAGLVFPVRLRVGL